MTSSFFNWLQRSPLVCFFTLAFLFTWSNWIPRALASHGLINAKVPDFMFGIAGYGPALAAIITTGLIYGREGFRTLRRKLCHWRVGPFWYAVALFLPAAQTLSAFGLHVLFGGTTPGTNVAPQIEWTALGIQTLMMILMFTLGFDGLGEELGWRGFALPRLLKRYPALGASIVMGAIWALWHLPYALTKGSAMAENPLGYLPHMFAASILFTWIFNNTEGSVLLAILFHAAGNVTFNILPKVIPGVYDSGLWGELIRWTVVGAVIFIAGPRHLSRKNTRQKMGGVE